MYIHLWQNKNKNLAVCDKSIGPCSVVGHIPTLPWVRSRVWVRVTVASGKGWVGTWPVTRLDPSYQGWKCFLTCMLLWSCPPLFPSFVVLWILLCSSCNNVHHNPTVGGCTQRKKAVKGWDFRTALASTKMSGEFTKLWHIQHIQTRKGSYYPF